MPHPALGLIHHASSAFWGALYASLLGRRRTPGRILGAALAVTALAAYTDLRAVPDRLSPGFQHRLRPRSVAAVYVAVACGLGLAMKGTAAPRRRKAAHARSLP